MKAAAYCRESHDDINALWHQADVVRKRIEEQKDLEFYREYDDLGFTGRDFDRNGWKSLVADIGKFQCIVVADLSRLGRNHIEVSDAIEMLRMKNIRLISILEHVDTANELPGDAFMIELYNFMNDMYLRDTSSRTHAALDHLRKQGKLIASAPYGYDGKLEPKEDEAAVVRRIFDEYIIGHGFTEIARGLTEDHIPNPREKEIWSPNTVRYILANNVYIGTYEAGRERQTMLVRRPVPEEAWIVQEGHHPPIVSQGVYEAAQERLRQKRAYVRHIHEPEDYGELMEIAYCGRCDRPLLHRDGEYFCRKCRAKVDEVDIKACLTETALAYQRSLPDVLKMRRTRLERLLPVKNKRVKAAEEIAKQAWEVSEAVYDRFCDGEITLEEWMEVKDGLSQAWQDAEAERDIVIEERDIYDRELKACIAFSREGKKITDPEELVKNLISRAELKDKVITVQVKMADRIAEFFDWWEPFQPEIILIE